MQLKTKGMSSPQPGTRAPLTAAALESFSRHVRSSTRRDGSSIARPSQKRRAPSAADGHASSRKGSSTRNRTFSTVQLHCANLTALDLGKSSRPLPGGRAGCRPETNEGHPRGCEAHYKCTERQKQERHRGNSISVSVVRMQVS